ncbi:MAG: hypothetical protein NTW97_06010 [Candidatus Krumholzibacteria bacterium]|nr:hypothetical protein [Candidatus Krumholzibacteria bacterium]
MVKWPVGLWVALSIVSCGAARRPAEGLEIPDPWDGARDEMVQRAGEEPDLAQKDFEIAEYLDHLELDDGPPVRATCRLTEGMISLPGKERTDGYLALSAERWKALCRGRRMDGAADAISWYLSGGAFSGAVRLHAGRFVPDFALGLLFGGSGGSSLSSSAFPFRSPRRIAGTTSFFLQTLYGAGGEVRCGGVYAAFFEGRPVTYEPNGTEAGERRISGARIEVRRSGAEIGISGSTGASESGRYVCGIDGRWRSDRMHAGLEIGFDRSGEPGVLSGFSYRVPGTRAALLLYAVPPGAAGVFGSVNGRTPGLTSSIGGAAVAAEREVFRRIRARASIDRYGRFDGFHETVRQSTRLECERRGRRNLLRLTWIRAGDARRDVVPYPPADQSGLVASHSLGLLSEFRIDGKTRIGVVLKRIEEADGLGWLVAPVLRADLLSTRLRVTASFAAYRTVFGRPVCYFSEPSLRGSFPLCIVSRNTDRGALLIGFVFKQLDLFLHAALEDGGVPKISLQASADL